MMRAAILLAAVACSGCMAGLNVAWVIQASYNTPATTNATMTTGAVAGGAASPASAASAAK